MSTLWLREYQDVGTARNFVGVPIPREPGTDQTPVTYTTSAQSAAFGGQTNYITMISDHGFHYVVGANPTATTNHLKVPANTLVTIAVQSGHKVAVIESA